MFDIRLANALLIEATTMLLGLRGKDYWVRELPSRCPPILWFGNALSSKPKVLTIAANPSRWEYLDISCKGDLDKVKENGDESLLRYLEPPSNRFRVLNASSESFNGIRADRKLREEIIQGYNDYFLEFKNPFTNWFGKKDSYRVEGFLRGLGASFYDDKETRYQAIHIDLLPFATLSDFKKLQPMAAILFEIGWAEHVVSALIDLLRPAAVMVFGRTNVEHLGEHIDPSIKGLSWTKHGAASYQIGQAEELAVPFVGLSVNLGNPEGFSKKTLGDFGSEVGKMIGLDNTRGHAD